MTRINRLVSLLAQSTEVHVISLGKDPAQPEDLDCERFHSLESNRFPNYRNPIGLLKRKTRTILCNHLGFKKSIDFWFDESWRPQLRKLNSLHQYECVFAESIFASKGLCFFPQAIKIIDTIDVFFRRCEFESTVGNQWFHCESSQSEAIGWKRADVVLGIQEEETRIIQSLVPKTKVLTLGHPLRISSVYNPDIENKIGVIASATVSNAAGIRTFLDGPFQQLVKLRADLQFVVAGSVCDLIPDLPHVHKVGIVQELAEFYGNVSIVLNPVIHGTGLKIKTVEAIEHGCPILSTSVGLEGLRSLRCSGVVQCHDSKSWVEEIVRLLDDHHARKEASDAVQSSARNYCREVEAAASGLIHPAMTAAI